MRYNIITCIILIFIISILTIIIKTPLANGYELSVYDAYPWYFWLMIIASIVLGICLLIYNIFRYDKIWVILGISIMVFVNLIVILLPIFRGYFANLGDEITHLGLIKDIYYTGHVGPSNYYPASHMLASEIMYISDMSPTLIVKIMPSIFYMLYILGLYLLVKMIENKFRPLLVMAFGSILLFSYYNYIFMPTQFSLYMIPIILFVQQKKDMPSYKLEYKILLIILLILMPFLHPLGSIYLLIILLIYEISKKLCFMFNKIDPCLIKIDLTTSLILFAAFLAWILHFSLLGITIRKSVRWFLYGIGTPEIETISMLIQRTRFTMYDFLDLLIKNHGHEILYFLLSLIAIFLATKKIIRRDSLKIRDIFLPMLFIIFASIYMLSIFTDFTPVTGTSNRLITWTLFVSAMMNGLTFQEYLSKLENRKIYVYILAIIIVISMVIGIFNVYDSPYIKRANWQVTQMDWNGIRWFYDNKEMSTNIYIGQLLIRAPDFIFGYDSIRPGNIGRFSYVYPHFGYDTNQTLTYPYNLNAYLVITERDKAIYTKLWPNFGILNYSDFGMLDIDPTVSKIYFNGGTEIWYKHV